VARRSGGERRAAPALVRRVGQKEAFEDFRQREASRDELGWGAAMLEVVELRAAAKSNGFSNNLQISDGPAETPHRFVHWSADRHTQFYPAFPYAACLPARPRAGLFFAPDQPRAGVSVKRTILARPVHAGLIQCKTTVLSTRCANHGGDHGVVHLDPEFGVQRADRVCGDRLSGEPSGRRGHRSRVTL
jgi:hypothetical protein